MISGLDSFYENQLTCQECQLAKTRERVVTPLNGEGSSLMIITGAPDEVDEIIGHPLTGAPGRLLEDALEAAGLSRSDVFITSVVRCRPPNNRSPQEDEINACSSFLVHEILACNPSVIICLGKVAAEALIDHPFDIASNRGKWYKWNDIPMVVTFHPSDLLAQMGQKTSSGRDLFNHLKRLFWQDLNAALNLVRKSEKAIASQS